MRKKVNIRFQHWVMITSGLLVATLSVAILATVLRTFTGIFEENAITRFSLIAERSAAELEGLLRQNGRFVLMQARGEASEFSVDGRINQQGVVSRFLDSLELEPAVYSHFFGLANEEFLQVIGIRGDERIAASLHAPEGAYFAVRRILRDDSGNRTDHYQFLDRARQTLGNREIAATLVPSQRPWYYIALQGNDLAVTDPYLFASTGELGLTVAAPLADKIGVLATDISLRSLQGFLATLTLPPNGAIAVLDKQGQVMAFHGRGKHFGSLTIAPMVPVAQLDPPLRSVLDGNLLANDSRIVRLASDGEEYVVTRHPALAMGDLPFRVVVVAPLTDFTGSFQQAERNVVVLSVLVLLVLMPLAFIGSRQVAHTLVTMASDSERLKLLDFSHAPQKAETFLYEINALGEAQYVMHDAILKRTKELVAAQDRLENLVATGIELGREHDRMALLRKILLGGKTLLNCDAGTLYLVTDHKTLRFALRTRDDTLPSFEIPLYDESGAPVERYMASWCALHNEPVVVDDVYAETRFDISGTRKMDADTGYRTVSMLTVPLSPRDGEVIAVLQFLNAIDPETGQVVPFPADLARFVTAMAAQAAVALDNHQLIETQKELLEAIIKLIAGAIDAKSHYTGGHCERVPELGMMLAEAACAAQDGPLADFNFRNEDEWREFRIGAWLHDCGKVTTPDFVIDKACKLETIHNRIHEVRTRFEVLLRDARIEQLEAVAAGTPPGKAQARYDERRARLADDFAFVAECNLGTEFMATESIERLKSIGATTWQRHFDDRLGLPHEERRRYPDTPAVLPATEHLLSDKPQHVIERADRRSVDPKWGFKIEVPENLYNNGELYNLSIERGTLTNEERFKINEHVMQSLIMLEQLPLPRNLRRIPEYAGTHHETLIGTGYPRRLADDQLTVPMRIMAVADVFEALTASDRPYKKAKTLSESIAILATFKKKKHIDPVIFDLFLTSGVYKRYAEKYLHPEQIDEVDIAAYLG
jgi:HD-GYP domain-containing protein (c-di-GMP phosphodiesterase class II)